MQKILCDIKPSTSNEVSIEKKAKREIPFVKDTKATTTDGILKRKSSQKSENYLNKPLRETWFEKQKNILQMAAIGVVVVLIINIFAVVVKTGFLKEDLSYSAYQGYQELVEGGENILQTNFSNAFNSFSNAQSQFDKIYQELWFLKDDPVISSEIQDELQDGGRFITIGDNMSQAGKDFAEGFQHLQKSAQLFFESKQNLVADFEDVQKRESITDALALALSKFKNAQSEIENADHLLSQINIENYPQEYGPRLKTATSQMKKLISYLDKVTSTFPAILKLLGDKHPHTYLVLFHNSNELRPVLGFIGSYAVVDVDEGYIEQLKIHDVYELDGQFYEEVPNIPTEIQKIGGILKMRDSNYSPDGEESLKSSAWFYQKQGGKSVDTVISIDQNILGQILSITGPLEIEGLNAPITADNYDFIVSYLVENKVYGLENPKQILNNIFEQISAKLKEQKYHAKTLELFINMIKDKRLLAYSKDEDIQNMFEKLGVTGKTEKWQEGSDGLQIIRTSIGGNKSDKYIKHNYTHTTYLAQNGDVINQVKVELEHNWHQGVMREWQNILNRFGFTDFNETVKDILGRGINKSGVRVYIPKGSELIDVIGMQKDEVQKLYDSTVDREYYYFEMEVSPQTSRKATLQYKLPFKLDVGGVDTYKLYYEPQIGARNVKLTKVIRGDVGLKNYKNFPEQELSPAQTIEYVVNGTNPQYFAGIWGK